MPLYHSTHGDIRTTIRTAHTHAHTRTHTHLHESHDPEGDADATQLSRPLEGVCLGDVTVVVEEDAGNDGEQIGRFICLLGYDEGAVLVEEIGFRDHRTDEGPDTVAEEHQLSAEETINNNSKQQQQQLEHIVP